MLCTYMYVFMYMYVCKYACMYVCMYVCMYSDLVKAQNHSAVPRFKIITRGCGHNKQVCLIVYHMAQMKRCLSDTVPVLAKKSKHKLGYNYDWKEEFPWHGPVYAEDYSAVIKGSLCSLCHNTSQRNSSGMWTLYS